MTKAFCEKVVLFDETLTDGRVTNSNTLDENFDLRSAILMSKRLGRALNDEELKLFKGIPESVTL